LLVNKCSVFYSNDDDLNAAAACDKAMEIVERPIELTPHATNRLGATKAVRDLANQKRKEACSVLLDGIVNSVKRRSDVIQEEASKSGADKVPAEAATENSLTS
jgi:hypothetical protein